MEITRKTQINEVITKNPEAAGEFFNAGMMCIGCPMSQGETIEQGCLGHGMSEKQINKFVENLNKKYTKESPRKQLKKKNNKKTIKKKSLNKKVKIK